MGQFCRAPKLYYVGIKTAREILAIVRRFERNAGLATESDEQPTADPSSR